MLGNAVPNYTNSKLRAELSASQRSAYTFYETEQLRTEFSASSRSAKFIYLFIYFFVRDFGRNLLHRHITLNLIISKGICMGFKTTFT